LVAARRSADFGPVAPSDDQEIARWREPTEELKLFEFEGQLSIDDQEEKQEEEDEAPEGQEEDEGDWFPGQELLALMQARATSLHFAARSASTGLPINIPSNGGGSSDGQNLGNAKPAHFAQGHAHVRPLVSLDIETACPSKTHRGSM
jgi:hypothetical protein